MLRFSIAPDSLAAWVEKAEEWLLDARLLAQEELTRLTRAIDGPGGYHVGLEAQYPTVEALRATEAQYLDRVEQLGAAWN